MRSLILLLLLADVRLAWDAPTGDPVAFNVYRAEMPGQFAAPLNGQPVTATTFADSGVPPGTFFDEVRSVNEAGESPPSNQIIVIVPAPNLPPTVDIRNPLDGQVIFAKNFTISVMATDDTGVTRMDLFINGVPVKNNAGPTLAHGWNTSPYKGKGPVTIRASARDADNEVASSEVVVTVNK